MDTIDANTYKLYMSKLHGKSVWDDLVLAFPCMALVYEQILTWNGKFNSVKTYDTGANNNPQKKFLRPVFM